MWRACIGTIWIDGKIDEKELSWINQRIESLNFTDEQKSILKNDVTSNINLPEILEKITDQKDRAFLAYQMRIIGHLDDQYTNSEKKLFKNWNEIVLKAVDLNYLEKLINNENNNSENLENKRSLFEKLLRE